MNCIEFLELVSLISFRLLTFFGERDLARVDSAFANHHIRREYLDKISRALIPRLKYDSRNKSWIEKRNVRPEFLSLGENVVDEDVLKLTEQSAAVLEIASTSTSLSSLALTQLVKHCPQLQRFDYASALVLSSQVYHNIALHCKNLSELSIRTTETDTEGFRKVLQACPKLRKISIVCTVWSLQSQLFEDVASFCPSVTSFCAVNVHTVRVLSMMSFATRCTHLTTLRLTRGGAAVEAGLRELCKHCRDLTVLGLQGCVVSNHTIMMFAHHNPRLKQLSLPRCSSVSEQCVCCISMHCALLQVVDLSNHEHVTDLAVFALATYCPLLSVLSLGSIQQITDVAAGGIGKCARQLLRLDVSNCLQITPVGMIVLVQGCTKLEALEVGTNSTNDAFFAQLAIHCPNFRHLSTSEPQAALNTTVLHSVSNYLCRLTHLSFVSVTQVPDTAVLQVVQNCPHLRTLVIWRLFCVCRDKRIVKTIGQNCKQLTSVHLGACSGSVYNAMVNLVEQRRKEGVVLRCVWGVNIIVVE